ncbi:MAG: hypothetical protein ACI4JB_11905, partial [Porcipelethomonas sp.]
MDTYNFQSGRVDVGIDPYREYMQNIINQFYFAVRKNPFFYCRSVPGTAEGVKSQGRDSAGYWEKKCSETNSSQFF